MNFKAGDYVEIDCGWYHLIGTIISKENRGFCSINVDAWKEKDEKEWSSGEFGHSLNSESQIIAIKKTRTRWQSCKA